MVDDADEVGELVMTGAEVHNVCDVASESMVAVNVLKRDGKSPGGGSWRVVIILRSKEGAIREHVHNHRFEMGEVGNHRQAHVSENDVCGRVQLEIVDISGKLEVPTRREVEHCGIGVRQVENSMIVRSLEIVETENQIAVSTPGIVN